MINASLRTIQCATNWMLFGTRAAAAELLSAVHEDRAAAGARPLDDALVDDDFLLHDDDPIVRIVSPAAACVMELDTRHGIIIEL